MCASWLLVSVLVRLDPVLPFCTFLLNTISNDFLLSILSVRLYAFVLIANFKLDKPTAWKKPATAEIQGLSQRLVKSPGHRYWKDSQVLEKHPEMWLSVSDK